MKVLAKSVVISNQDKSVAIFEYGICDLNDLDEFLLKTLKDYQVGQLSAKELTSVAHLIYATLKRVKKKEILDVFFAYLEMLLSQDTRSDSRKNTTWKQAVQSRKAPGGKDAHGCNQAG